MLPQSTATSHAFQLRKWCIDEPAHFTRQPDRSDVAEGRRLARECNEFGTDYPFVLPAQTNSQLAGLGLPADVVSAIGQNAAALFPRYRS
jgi:hypothetical protein